MKWFLDVDGVVNCWPQPTFQEQMENLCWRDGKAATGGKTYAIWWDTRIIEGINRISRSGKVEIVWLTTWLDDAKTEIEPLVGLDSFSVWDTMEGEWEPSRLGWWKLRALESSLEPGEPFIWTDDDLTVPIIKKAKALGSKSLMITPNSNPGLTLEAIHEIEKFVEDNQ